MTELAEFWEMIWPELGRGLVITLRLSTGSLLIGLLIGFPIALMRVYGARWMKTLATIYVDLLRGTPLLVQLFFIYYGLADPNINQLLVRLGLPEGLLVLEPLTAAYLALGCNSGAYQAEYLRGAIQAIDAGQMIAARALGLSRLQAIRYIIMPQALRLVIAPWSNEVAYMVKYTSVVYIIAVQDLFGETRRIMSTHYNQMTMLPFVGMIYLVIVLLITWGMGHLEQHFHIPGLQIDVERG
ncbi:MAG TPA: amino acid ABC transporter permease [Thermoflexia bacterium]|nr:amino acid ABC transporter permease [Thermoflexia bacterium]